MTTLICGDLKCGVEFGVPEHIYNQARRHGMNRLFTCPNGHEQGWTETAADRLTKEVAGLKDRLAYKDDRIAEMNRQITGLKGQVTRLKNTRRAK